MQIVNQYEVLEVSYKSIEEFRRHRKQLCSEGWIFRENFIIDKYVLCARYEKGDNLTYSTVELCLRHTRCTQVVIKTVFDSGVIYKGVCTQLLTGETIEERILLERKVASHSEQNGVLTLIVK